MRKFLFITTALATAGCLGMQAQNDVDNSTTYRLFAPLTFYHSVAHNNLSLDAPDTSDGDEATEKALLDLYFNRPDLVTTTETELGEAGTLREDLLTTPIKQEAEITDQPAPLPDEPQIEQAEVVVTKPQFWTYKGDGYLQFMQNYVSGNWYKGGESNYSAVGAITLEANYDNKQKWKWDNKLEMKLGMQTSRTDQVHKYKANEDLIRLTDKVGLQATKKWYYTLQLLAYTQFTHGYKANDKKIYSDFMSPFNLNIGLGMDYKVEWLNKKITGTINIAPFAINYRYVGRSWFDRPDPADQSTWKWFPSRYGIDENSHHLLDVGSQLTASLQWQLTDNVVWKTRIYGFTSYKRTEIEWENTFAFKVSKYISANLFLFPRFDDANTRDDKLGFWQFKEYSSLGFSYNF